MRIGVGDAFRFGEQGWWLKVEEITPAHVTAVNPVGVTDRWTVDALLSNREVEWQLTAEQGKSYDFVKFLDLMWAQIPAEECPPEVTGPAYRREVAEGISVLCYVVVAGFLSEGIPLKPKQQVRVYAYRDVEGPARQLLATARDDGGEVGGIRFGPSKWSIQQAIFRVSHEALKQA